MLIADAFDLGVLGTGEGRPGDVKHSQASHAARPRALDFEPRRRLGRGLARILEWYRETVPAAV